MHFCLVSVLISYKISARRNIYLESQHPGGLDKIRELEAQGHPAKLEIEEPVAVRPTLTDLTVCITLPQNSDLSLHRK